jgi:hypothetical protein
MTDIPEFNDEAVAQATPPQALAQNQFDQGNMDSGDTGDEGAALPTPVPESVQPRPEKGFWRSYFDKKSGRDQQEAFDEHVREFEITQKTNAAEVASRLALIAQERATQHDNSIVNYMRQLTDVQNQIQAASEDAAKFEASGGNELSPDLGGLKKQHIKNLMDQQGFLSTRLQEMDKQREVRFDASEYLQSHAAAVMPSQQGAGQKPKAGGTKAPTGQSAPSQSAPPPQDTSPVASNAPIMTAQQAQQNPTAFGLDFVQRHVAAKAKTDETGQIVIHEDGQDAASERMLQIQQMKRDNPLMPNVQVIDDQQLENRKAQIEDRQAMAKDRQAKSADFQARDALTTAEPELRNVGVATMTGQDGKTHLVGPGGAAPSLVELTTDPKDPTKQMVQGASQEGAARALGAVADSAEKDPEAAKLVIRDMGQGIRAYVEDLASHGDVQRRGRTNDYVVNLFGRDPDEAQKIMESIGRISKAAKSKDTLPNLVLPDPGAATFQYSQYATTNQRAPTSGGRASASGMSDEVAGSKNDVEKLLGFLDAAVDPKLGTLNPLDSRRVIAAFEHPGGYMLGHFKGEGRDRVLKSRLMDLINPAQRAQLEDAIRRIP